MKYWYHQNLRTGPTLILSLVQRTNVPSRRLHGILQNKNSAYILIMFINLEEIEFKSNFSFRIAYLNQTILIYRILFVERATFVCLPSHQNSIIAKSKEALFQTVFPTKLIVNSTNGFFLTQTVLALTKFENMSLTKSSPSSDSGSFQHFFSVASTTVEGSFIHKNRRVWVNRWKEWERFTTTAKKCYINGMQ